MSRIELAVEKVRHLDETQTDALLEWLELRLEQLKRGEKIPGDQVHAEIQERSRRRRAGQNG